MATNAQALNSRQAFAFSTLHELGVPETQENANVLLAQMEAEEPPGTSAPYNPENVEVTTAQSHGDRGIVGGWSIAPQIAVFKTWGDGVFNYANELRKIAPGAVADMKRGAPATVSANDLAASGWGTSASLMDSILASGSERGSAAAASVTGGASGGQNTITPPKGGGTDSIIPHLPGGISNPLDGLAKGLVGGISSAVGGYTHTLIRIATIAGGILMLLAAVLVGVKM